MVKSKMRRERKEKLENEGHWRKRRRKGMEEKRN